MKYFLKGMTVFFYICGVLLDSFYLFRQNAAVRSLSAKDTDVDDDKGVEKESPLIIQESVNLINSCGLGSYEAVARIVVDILQKQRMANGKNWVFACFPYQQRVAKLVSDEFAQPLGLIRSDIEVCDDEK